MSPTTSIRYLHLTDEQVAAAQARAGPLALEVAQELAVGLTHAQVYLKHGAAALPIFDVLHGTRTPSVPPPVAPLIPLGVRTNGLEKGSVQITGHQFSQPQSQGNS